MWKWTSTPSITSSENVRTCNLLAVEAVLLASAAAARPSRVPGSEHRTTHTPHHTAPFHDQRHKVTKIQPRITIKSLHNWQAHHSIGCERIPCGERREPLSWAGQGSPLRLRYDGPYAHHILTYSRIHIAQDSWHVHSHPHPFPPLARAHLHSPTFNPHIMLVYAGS